jgi:hypothetical protein
VHPPTLVAFAVHSPWTVEENHGVNLKLGGGKETASETRVKIVNIKEREREREREKREKRLEVEEMEIVFELGH